MSKEKQAARKKALDALTEAEEARYRDQGLVGGMAGMSRDDAFPNHLLIRMLSRAVMRGDEEALGEVTEFFQQFSYKIDALRNSNKHLTRRVNELEEQVQALRILALTMEWEGGPDVPEGLQKAQESMDIIDEEMAKRT